MKLLLSFSSSLALILLLFCTEASVSSCQKETVYVHDTTTVTVIHRDTVIQTDTVPPTVLTNTQILAKNTWEIEELYQIVPSSGGDTTHYIRGVLNTTGYNQAAVRFTFHADGTGSYVSDAGTTSSMNWEFTSSDEKNMKLTLNDGIHTTVFYWSLVSISEGEILETTAQQDFLVSARLVPVH